MANGTIRNAEKKTSKGMRAGYEIDADLTLYRVPNPDAADVVNTCQKIAQKRAGGSGTDRDELLGCVHSGLGRHGRNRHGEATRPGRKLLRITSRKLN